MYVLFHKYFKYQPCEIKNINKGNRDYKIVKKWLIIGRDYDASRFV